MFLRLVVVAGEAQRAAAAVFALDAERLDELRDALVCAAPGLENGACPGASPERDLLAVGLSREQVLDELPDLEAEDITACLRFAGESVNRPVMPV